MWFSKKVVLSLRVSLRINDAQYVCLVGVCVSVCVCIQDATRMASAGCVGELCAFLSEEELRNVLLQHILGWYLCRSHHFQFFE